MPRVSIFRDFAEDERTSMDIYADGLSAALRDFAGERFEVSDQLPRPLNFLPGNAFTLRMRISRQFYYPWFARNHHGDVNHIVDHGYAHLLRTLDPQRTVVTVHDLIPLLSWKGCLPGPTRYPHRPLLFERAVRISENRGMHTRGQREHEKGSDRSLWMPSRTNPRSVFRAAFVVQDVQTG